MFTVYLCYLIFSRSVNTVIQAYIEVNPAHTVRQWSLQTRKKEVRQSFPLSNLCKISGSNLLELVSIIAATNW